MARLTEGFAVGHWTDPQGRSGCTVVLPPPGNVASCDVRGSAPSSRELELLHPERRLTEIHGVVLTGGSAFGLASAHGVVEWLAEREVGYQTSVAVVPIVAAAVINDLRSAAPDARPGPDEGRAACDAATAGEVSTGAVGAGAGATVGKWAGLEHAVPGGVGCATVRQGAAEVSAIAVVNSVGDVLAPDGTPLAGTTAVDPVYDPPASRDAQIPSNTVLAVVTTKAEIEKREVKWLASRGSDGIAIAVRPAHTRYDGDVVVAIVAPPGPGDEPVSLDVIGMLATRAVADAIRDAVT